MREPPAADGFPPAVYVTAWLPVLCWYLAEAAFAGRATARGRAWWTAGCGLLWLHVGVAMGAAHGWSHAAAVEHTERASGFGPGVFVNYAVGLAWAADAARMWANPAGRRPRWADGWSPRRLALRCGSRTSNHGASRVIWRSRARLRSTTTTLRSPKPRRPSYATPSAASSRTIAN